MTAVCGQINPIAEGTKVPRDDDLLSQIILMLCHGENAVKMVVGLRRNGAGVIKEMPAVWRARADVTPRPIASISPKRE
ncbi:MAG: hypothetical protein JOZ29_12625 [Deltaproteobacteria bacterium]|nr:hypothetical protein [Deltaproteobacteria bacterium]